MTPATRQADSAELFAEDLRLLRVRSGSPTLSHLQHTTGISRTVLSDAFNGRQLPSARTVDGVVRACGADPEEWIRRRDRLAAAPAARADDPVVLTAEEPILQESVPREPAGEQPRRPRRLRRRTVALIAVAAFVVGAGIGGGVVGGVLGSRISALGDELAAAGPVNPQAQIVVRTGVDPAMTPCVNDAKVAASEDRTNDTRIQIVWSNKCYAGWARIARYDGKADGNLVKISIYPETAPTGPDRQDATEPGVQGAYTTLIVRPTPDTRLCAVGAITVNGETIDLGEPICT